MGRELGTAQPSVIDDAIIYIFTSFDARVRARDGF